MVETLGTFALMVAGAASARTTWKLASWECMREDNLLQAPQGFFRPLKQVAAPLLQSACRTGVFKTEVRRKAAMQRRRGEGSFPQPCETRVRVATLAGVVVWRTYQTIGLPSQCDARISSISPLEFDAHFEPEFRLAPPEKDQRLS